MSNYDASSIQIKPHSTEAYYWEKVGILARDFNRDSGWIERGLEACERAGVSHQYFIDRYLLKKDIPLNSEVNTESMKIQREWVLAGKL